MPKVSIVLPCYNGSSLLGEAITSCINQTFQDWELIIINDCSTDNTLEIAASFAATDSRIRVYTNEINSKLPASLNNGFKKAQGAYWTWTSDDNIMHPKMLEKMVSFLDNNSDVGMIISNSYVIDINGNIIAEKVVPIDLQSRMMLNNYVGASFMYRKDCANLAGEYREDMFLVEDYEFFLRMSFCCKFAVIPEFLYYYRDNPNSLTATRQKEIKERLTQLRIMYLNQSEKILSNQPQLLRLVYYRIVDNLEGFDKLKYFCIFVKRLPIYFGIKYLFVHLPNRWYKSLK